MVRRCEDQLMSVATKAKCGREVVAGLRAHWMHTVQMGASTVDRDDCIRIWQEFDFVFYYYFDFVLDMIRGI